MKKLVAIITLLVFTIIPSMAFANDTISVAIDGQVINFDGQAPVIVDGRTLVPVRGVFEAMGFNVSWDGGTRTATLSRGIHVVSISIDSDVFTMNGISYTLEVPAQIINGSTMLPIRAVLESVGYDLEWEGATQTVVIIPPVPVVITPVVPVIPEPTIPVVEEATEVVEVDDYEDEIVEQDVVFNELGLSDEILSTWSAGNMLDYVFADNSASEIRDMAERGDAVAQVLMGLMYMYGHGVAQDYSQAFYWTRLSAEQELPRGMNALGMSYSRANQDYEQALYWTRRAAEKGNSIAQVNLAWLYRDGNGVAQNHAQAVY